MKYDFTSIIDRHNMDAIAVDGLGVGKMSPAKPKEGFDVIPMWVADMNFPSPSLTGRRREMVSLDWPKSILVMKMVCWDAWFPH